MAVKSRGARRGKARRAKAGRAEAVLREGAGAEDGPRERVLTATIQVIERHGVNGATVRRIVGAAGVNIAAINYYFGGKDRLLREALAHTLHEAFPKALDELRVFIEAHSGDIPAGTRAFFLDYLPNTVLYPRIAVAHLRDALLEQDYSGPGVAEMRNFVQGFLELVAPAMPHSTEAAKRLSVIHVWATIYLLALMPGLFALEPGELTGTGATFSGLAERELFGR